MLGSLKEVNNSAFGTYYARVEDTVQNTKAGTSLVLDSVIKSDTHHQVIHLTIENTSDAHHLSRVECRLPDFDAKDISCFSVACSYSMGTAPHPLYRSWSIDSLLTNKICRDEISSSDKEMHFGTFHAKRKNTGLVS